VLSKCEHAALSIPEKHVHMLKPYCSTVTNYIKSPKIYRLKITNCTLLVFIHPRNVTADMTK